MRALNLIVIHCSATPNGEAVGALEIDSWHRKRGFRRAEAARLQFNPALLAIGYHFLVLPNGHLASGRGLDEQGAHCLGHNKNSIGICMIGTDKFSRSQWSSLAMLVRNLSNKYPLDVMGHRDLSPDVDRDGEVEPWEWLKTCPNFDAAAWHRCGMQPVQGCIFEEATHGA